MSVVPRGVFKRTILEEPIGQIIDVSTSVFWLQTTSLFADVRVHAAPPEREAKVDSFKVVFKK